MHFLVALSAGLALLQRGYSLEARAALEEAVRAQPQSAPALLDLAEPRLAPPRGRRAGLARERFKDR